MVEIKVQKIRIFPRLRQIEVWMFFLKKEPKTVALRGYNELTVFLAKLFLKFYGEFHWVLSRRLA
jgi:hypothetical protein